MGQEVVESKATANTLGNDTLKQPGIKDWTAKKETNEKGKSKTEQVKKRKGSEKLLQQEIRTVILKQ